MFNKLYISGIRKRFPDALSNDEEVRHVVYGSGESLERIHFLATDRKLIIIKGKTSLLVPYAELEIKYWEKFWIGNLVITVLGKEKKEEIKLNAVSGAADFYNFVKERSESESKKDLHQKEKKVLPKALVSAFKSDDFEEGLIIGSMLSMFFGKGLGKDK